MCNKTCYPLQEAISDSPFYSTSAQYDHNYIASENTNEFHQNSTLPPINPHLPTCPHPARQGSSLPTLIMTDNGGDDWEILSEVKIRLFHNWNKDILATALLG